jgi:hypothetical protein
MQYTIISTGSKGNAVVLEKSILIDCGVSWKALKPYVRDLQIVLLTHCHQDHFLPSTIRRLAAERPCCRFGCGEWMVPLLVDAGVQKKNIDVYEFGKQYGYRYDERITMIGAFPLFHDIPNCGYAIGISDGPQDYKYALYATDTSKILTEAKDYDLYLVEANYEAEEVQERIDAQIIDGQDYIHEYKAMKNHLSEKDALDFIAANAGAKSVYVLLHGHEAKEGKA